MDRIEIIDVIAVVVGEVMGREAPDLTESVRLVDHLNMDSTSLLELLMALEDRTGIEIDIEDLTMDDFRTVGSLTDFLARTISGAAVS